MPKNNSAQIFGSRFYSVKKRRPAGVSRRDKYRKLQIETLEARQVMSATPVSYDFDHTDVVMHDLLMDSHSLRTLTQTSDLSQYSEAQLAATTQWVVFTELGTDLSAYAAEGGFTVTSATDIVPGSFILTVGAGGADGLISALSGEGAIDFFYPLVPFQLEGTAITNDPLLERQWHLVNFGQEVGNPNFGFLFGTVDEDINIEEAWDFYTGNGVVVGIVDSGTQVTHPDLAGNIRPDLAIDLAGGDNDPTPTGNDAHGTAVAGLVGAVGNNNEGGVGVAYNADLAPIRLFSDDPFNPIGVDDFTIAQALLHQFQEIDIYNHSWGIPPVADDQGVVENPRAIIDFGPLATLALRNSVFFGRGGLGSIHVFAAGNSAGIRDGGNNSGQVNSRYTIAVGSVIEDGTATSYAESGAAILVVAPSGSNPETIIRDNELGAGIVTTDQTGQAGFNQAPVNGSETDADYLLDTDYSSRFNGTSASAPIVSGVIALMLEANPNLTYRDVQHILVRSARQNAVDDASWITNVNEFFADPLAFDFIEDDTIFDGAWPFPSLGDPEGNPGDPDADPPVPPGPTPDKFVYYQELRMPEQFTNGAGFTVSQMTTNEEYGFGHGVVDAAMAVELARNWVTLGGQQSEFTWTTGPTLAPKIVPAAVSNEETGEFRVPGGVSPNGDGPVGEPNEFIEYLNEFGAEDDPAVPDLMADPPEDPDGPFSGDDPPVNTRDAGSVFVGQNGIPITGVPSMEVEWIEVQVNIGGDENDMDFLRISLISPDGTVSELKLYDIPNVDNPVRQNINFEGVIDPAGVLSPGSGGLTAVYTTNRHWGERTEGKPRINTDGTPVRAFNEDTAMYDGDIIVDGWRLVFENFSDSEMDIFSYEVAFHGIAVEGTGRIQGSVGVDDNGDGVFSDALGLLSNFTRYVEIERETIRPDSMPEEILDFRYVGDGSYQFDRLLNGAQESWAAGVIVYADLDTNGLRDATDPSYQVGADGNYYFDLPAGLTYDIRIDPASLEAAGLFNQQNVDAVSGVLATAEINEPGERVLATPAIGDPLDPLSDADTVVAAYGFNGGITSAVTALNIMLVANAVPENIFNIKGVVYADLNENGVQDGDDVVIEDATVFIDVNQNGVFTPGVDPFRNTVAGFYSFEDLEVAPGFYAVRVLEGTTGTFGEPVNPDDASREFFFDPAPEIANFTTPDVFVSIDANGIATYETDFGFTFGQPGGGGPSGTVAISGVVFNDKNETGTRQQSELGLQNVAFAYIDADGDNIFDSGDELRSNPSATGTFFFNALPPGTYTVRLEIVDTNYRQTVPIVNDMEYVVTLTSGNVATGLLFGLKNSLTADWGDLPAQYFANFLATNPGATDANHQVDDVMWLGDPPLLGSSPDTESGPAPNSDAHGDDTTGLDDEDGVGFGVLRDNSTTLEITVKASTNGGWLQGWMDWNQDGLFSASERVFDDQLLPVGTSVFTVNVPTALLTDGKVFARFRYGEQGLDSAFSTALRGEVEDYSIDVVSTAIDPGVQILHGPDFDEDGDVDGRDFLAWQRGFGKTTNVTPADGDANSDGTVDGEDLDMWQDDYATDPNPGANVIHGPDFDDDTDVDGRDFLAWQRGYSKTLNVTAADGDANSDGTVGGDDLEMWQNGYGTTGGNLSAVVAGNEADLDVLPINTTFAVIVDTVGDDNRVAAIEISARQSTFGHVDLRGLNLFTAAAARFSGNDEIASSAVIEIEDLDAAFDEVSEDSESSPASAKDDESLYRIDDEAGDQSDEDNAFELAFAEAADWRQF
ncbi:MAG: S8 family serine peptidase [Bythopirellula sp.]|nr:S8 family serine peptidase [Bythopirellula sp.]